MDKQNICGHKHPRTDGLFFEDQNGCIVEKNGHGWHVFKDAKTGGLIAWTYTPDPNTGLEFDEKTCTVWSKLNDVKNG